MKKHFFGKIIIVIAMILSTAIVSCKKDYSGTPSNNNTTPAANEVSISNMAFSPSTLTVSVGTTVKWTNNDGVTHTVTSRTGAFESGNLANGKTFSFTFSSTGTFSYYCTIHPSMAGSVVIQ